MSKQRWGQRGRNGVLLLVATALLAPVATAQARTTIIAPEDAHLPYQQWVDEAKVPTPNVTLTVIEGPCTLSTEFATACTGLNEFTIWIEEPLQPQFAFYHEVGHNFDYYVMTEWGRSRYLALLHRQGEDWRTSGRGGYKPVELFADSWAGCAIKPFMPHVEEVRGQEPVGGWRVHNRICHLIRRAM